MSGSVNKCTILGRLTRDPEARSLQSGDPVVNLSVATSETWKDKASGQRKEKSEFHNVVIFNKGLCGVAEKYLRKGSQVYLEGKLQTRSWEDQSGQKRYTTEIVLSGYGGELVLIGGRNSGSSNEPASRSSDPDDDLPANW